MVKEFWKSKTVWAAIAAAIIAGLSSFYGDTNQFVSVAIALASAFGIYGRVQANEPLALK